jgi:hypothetical protein
MADLIYSAIASLAGHVADRDGRFDWAVPDEEARDIAIGGPDLVGQAIRAGMVYLQYRTATHHPASAPSRS